MASALFDGKHPDQVTSAQLKNHFYTHVEPIVATGLRRGDRDRPVPQNPKKVRARWFGYGFVVAVVLGVLTAIMALAHVTGWGWFMLGSIVAVIIVWAFARTCRSGRPRVRRSSGSGRRSAITCRI